MGQLLVGDKAGSLLQKALQRRHRTVDGEGATATVVARCVWRRRRRVCMRPPKTGQVRSWTVSVRSGLSTPKSTHPASTARRCAATPASNRVTRPPPCGHGCTSIALRIAQPNAMLRPAVYTWVVLRLLPQPRDWPLHVASRRGAAEVFARRRYHRADRRRRCTARSDVAVSMRLSRGIQALGKGGRKTDIAGFFGEHH